MFFVYGSSSDDVSAAVADVEMTVLDDIQTDGGEGGEREDATINSGRAGTASADEWTASVADDGDSSMYRLPAKHHTIHKFMLGIYISDGEN